jgi:hypothetical protein
MFLFFLSLVCEKEERGFIITENLPQVENVILLNSLF